MSINDSPTDSTRLFNMNYPDKNVQATYVVEPVRNFTKLACCRIKTQQCRIKTQQYQGRYANYLKYCEFISNRVLENRFVIYNICFSNEFNFTPTGAVNKHNCRYQIDDNSHLYWEYRPKDLRNFIFARVFLVTRLLVPFTPMKTYLENFTVLDVVQEDKNLIEHEVVFQQDGTPLHSYVRISTYLDQTFPERCISQRQPLMAWEVSVMQPIVQECLRSSSKI